MLCDPDESRVIDKVESSVSRVVASRGSSIFSASSFSQQSPVKMGLPGQVTDLNKNDTLGGSKLSSGNYTMVIIGSGGTRRRAY